MKIKTCFLHKWNFKRHGSINEIDYAMKMKWKYVRAKGRVGTGKIKKATKSCICVPIFMNETCSEDRHAILDHALIK